MALSLPQDACRPRREDARHVQARLQLILDSLVSTIYFNPVVMAIVVMALAAGHLGGIPAHNMLAAVGLQLVVSVAAWIVRRRNTPLAGRNLDAVHWELIALQAMIGLFWGGTAWLLWRDGNPGNNVILGLVLCGSMWSSTLERSSSWRVLTVSIVTMTTPFALRMMASGEAFAHVMLWLVPFMVGYVVMQAKAARRQVDQLIAARFDNEDMGIDLLAARDEALHKRMEAEAANQTKTAFLANMSHELRTPLNAILGFSEIISTQALGPKDERYQDYAKDIHSSGSHLLALINDILDVAKIEAGKMELNHKPLDVPALFDSIERLMAVRARQKGHCLSFDLAEDAPVPHADERAFRQILLNLLSNAEKYTPEGGRIMVTGRAAEEGGFLLSVEDTGCGIPADRQEKIFEAFTCVDNRFDHNVDGTGLGLALVQGLAQLHGGRAWMESEVGAGTTVHVYFPLSTPNTHNAAAKFASSQRILTNHG